MVEEQKSQNQIFNEALESVLQVIDDDMASWDFPTLIAELKRNMVEQFPKKRKNIGHAVRYFSRHYLGMEGQKFAQVRKWIDGQAAMSEDEICLVFQALQQLRDGTIKDVARRGSKRKSKKKVKREVPEVFEQELRDIVTPVTSGYIRGLIDHTKVTFHSLMMLIFEAGIKPSDLFDGDRIEMRRDMKDLCQSFGIDVVFPEPKAAQSRPVTSDDLANIGLTRRIK